MAPRGRHFPYSTIYTTFVNRIVCKPQGSMKYTEYTVQQEKSISVLLLIIKNLNQADSLVKIGF